MTAATREDGPPAGVLARLRALPSGTGLGLVAVAAIYVFHLLYGALLSGVSLIMTCVWAGLLGVALATRWGRRACGRAPNLLLPGILFALVILAALWSLTPWTPGGPHPVWAYIKVKGGSASIDPSSTEVEIAKLLGLGCIFALGVFLGGVDDRARALLGAVVYLGAAFAAAIFLMHVAGTGADAGRPRLEGNFLSANTAGTVCGTLLVLAIARVTSALRRGGGREGPLGRAGLPAACALLFLACLIATASRMAMVATGAALTVQFVWDALSSKSRNRWVVLGAAVAATVAVVLLVTIGEQALGRFLNIANEASSRRVMAAEHWKAFLASPINGYGLGSFDALNLSLLNQDNFGALWSIHAVHNVYLQWLEEAGLVGAAPMFLAIAVVMATVVRGTSRRSHMTSWLHALVACDLLILLHGLTDFALQTPSVASYWALLLGLQYGLAQSATGRAPEARPEGRRAGLCGAVAAGAATAAVLCLSALSGGGESVPGVTVAAGFDQAANKALSGPQPRWAEAMRASRAATQRYPYDSGAWLRQAFIESQAGPLGPDAREAIRKSYELVAYEPDLAYFRVGFCLEHWDELTTEIRKAVRAEAHTVGAEPGHKGKLIQVMRAVRNPAGRLAGVFWALDLMRP